ncbi:hypothetical protein [Marinoscillum sp. MHG1-6]|uniref:hypothetical protein n=1 Tax=Marinoscillum sp. MHG1-6 TaxID=2959627 RepID=UPI002157DA65|nr:hypothetical protein [Marinoscillum sp. MHG1-6]
MRNLFIAIFAILALSSCSNYLTLSEKRTMSLTPDFVRLDVRLDDFEYLGTTEISVQSREYFGFIQKIDSINNRAYNYRDVRIVDLMGKQDIRLKGEMKKALYKVVDEYPEATYYMVESDYQQISRSFMGRQTVRKMQIQAFKYKIN